jgi:hypothetical protein
MILLLLLLLVLLLGGLGFAVHVLWYVLLAVLVIAVIGYVLRA